MKRLKIEYSFAVMWSVFYLLDEQNLFPHFVFAAVVHECGHYLALRLVGGQLRFMRLSAFGAEMRVWIPGGYGKEIIVAAAGPAGNLLAAVLLAHAGLELGAGACVLLGAINLLPAKPLDGGRILGFLFHLTPAAFWEEKATFIVSIATAALLCILGALVFIRTRSNITVFLMGLALFASQVKSSPCMNRKISIY